MCFLIPVLLIVLGIRSLAEGRALTKGENDSRGSLFRASGAAEVVLGVVMLGSLIARGCSGFGGVSIMMGAGLTVSAVLFFLFRRGRRGQAPNWETRRELAAELLIVVGGIALVISGLTT